MITQGCCTQNDHLEKTSPLCEGIFQIWQLLEPWSYGWHNIHKDEHIVLKMYNPKKMSPDCKGIFRIQVGTPIMGPKWPEFWWVHRGHNASYRILNSGQKVQPKYGFGAKPDPELTPLQHAQSAQERHKWDHRSPRLNPIFRSKSTTQIWIWSWIQDPELTPKNWSQFGTHMVIHNLRW